VILVDTSVWIEHLRAGSARLAGLLLESEVLVHPFVVGELACGHLNNRREVLALLDRLPASRVARDAELRYFIESSRLMGRGIGFVDAHLLAAVALTPGSLLWTGDRRLAGIAADLGFAY
jgi:predicted nucleic acid-binding protein